NSFLPPSCSSQTRRRASHSAVAVYRRGSTSPFSIARRRHRSPSLDVVAVCHRSTPSAVAIPRRHSPVACRHRRRRWRQLVPHSCRRAQRPAGEVSVLPCNHLLPLLLPLPCIDSLPLPCCLSPTLTLCLSPVAQIFCLSPVASSHRLSASPLLPSPSISRRIHPPRRTSCGTGSQT
ncbi:unnamed protein product, partial [Linum tenue]